MTTKDLVDIAQFLLNCLLAFFTIWLFSQGQRDRRRLAEDQRRQQASKVSLFLSQPASKIRWQGQTQWKAMSSAIEIYNDSDAAITDIKVFRHLSASHTARESEPVWELVNLVDDPVPTIIQYLAGGQVESVDCDSTISAHDLELHFTDGAGCSWVKTLRDGRLWSTNKRPVPWWAAWYQRSTQLRGIGTVFFWPIRHATRRFEKVYPKIPLAMRVARFLWGSVPGPSAEPDPWRRPPFCDFPARDWPYQSMIWWFEYKRGDGVALSPSLAGHQLEES